ncbi:MAG: hypothetical protein Q8P33_01335 [bacterium]|nr:hypothetical protein [bacterium]
MKTSYFILTLLGALVIGAGIAALVLYSGSAQTQVVGTPAPCTISPLDQDGDCLPGDLDYYPYDETR